MTGGSKFEVSKFDGHGNFGLWQTRVKDLLAQQGIQKGLCAEKPKGMEDDDWQDLQKRAAGTIRLCLADEVISKSRDKSKGRKNVTCYKCKEQGHFKRDCPKWKKQTADMSSKSANVVQNEESDCSDGDVLSISTAQYDDAWILDSGYSYHITPN
ncbi:Unknown protein [Striga hermonthica]|uniref:CCHC-type domain-containing protein n=1 Tax=Striga hermonthica TaxID=68872 RepID=A0A9N7QZ02_STRHE|nr:Unknown protein [Striga hermonthica]